MRTCHVCGQENRDSAKFCEECATPFDVSRAAREQRKTVTVLFCDVTGSTALGESSDPEAFRALLVRYFERMKGIVESHGGTVEKFIGDAVMAVFGVPRVHEDDALRAVRAAREMRDALPELGVSARVGLNTGEVVTGTEERLATGDAVNVAARLEQAAQPGEILIGQETLALVRDAVEAEAVEPLELKGKAERVAAFRLLSVHDAPERRHESRFVGRERELERLRESWTRVLDDESCEFVTILGDAGVGKSRLVAEFLTTIDARVLSGRCLPYGEGITYLPVVEVVRQLDSLPSNPGAAHPLRSLLGETEESTSADQIAWGFRKLLEEQAPLVCLFDDIHWGEETFLDLVEATALLASGPILVLCLARPDLVERRPQWPVALGLEPLPDYDVDSLISGAVPDELRHKITRAAGGNPLFATEMVALAREVRGEVFVPPTLQALLAARLDQLDLAERGVLECGAVEGEIFHRGAVQALSGGDQVTPQLAALVRKQLIRPDKAQLLGEDAFRFRHLLIRDAAYRVLPKGTRAELHERVADWLEERGQDLVELDELLGHHLEQAARYKAELGQRDPKLAQRAGERLAAAGGQALDRADYPAAASLLGRAVSLLPPGRRGRAVLLPDLAAALVETGEPECAASVLEKARSAADVLSDQGLAARESVVRCHFQRQYAPDRFVEEARREMPKAIETFAGLGDDLGVAQAWRALGMSHFDRLQFAAAEEAFRRGAASARLAGNRGEEAANIGQTIAATIHGPTSVTEALRRLDQLQVDRDPKHGEFVPWWLGIGSICRGVFAAMSGRFGEGRALVAEARSSAEALGSDVRAAGWARHAGRIELLADDPIRAERELRPAYERLAATREKGWRASVAFLLAEALWRQRRADEALECCEISREIGGPEDLQAQIGWRSVRAKVLAGRGEMEEAERLAREAVALAAETDALTMRGDALTALVEVLVLANRTEEAAQCLGCAHELYEAKGDVVSAGRARAVLEELRQATPHV